MADVFTPEKRSKIMASIREKNTKPEIMVRRLLHGAGYRFTVHAKSIPGKPDVYFSAREKAIFVNGCFWHGHQNCRRASLPNTNKKFWSEKIQGNVRRDLQILRRLADKGIKSFVVWECELSDIESVVQHLREFLGAPRHC